MFCDELADIWCEFPTPKRPKSHQCSDVMIKKWLSFNTRLTFSWALLHIQQAHVSKCCSFHPPHALCVRKTDNPHPIPPAMYLKSHTPSLYAGSTRSKVLEEPLPRFETIEPKPNTNSTMTGISGPGRILGLILSSVGRRLEQAIDHFAEAQLGLGPNMAALRLTSALHRIHVDANHACLSDDSARMKTSCHVTDRLIWVCNGYCSRCGGAYLPHVLTELPKSVLKEIIQLIRYLRYV